MDAGRSKSSATPGLREWVTVDVVILERPTTNVTVNAKEILSECVVA